MTENGPNRFPMPQNQGIDTKIKSVACSEPKLQFWPIQTWPKFPKWPFWPLRSIWGVWKWSQSISHAQILWHRHQNQVCSPIGPIPPLTPHIGPLCDDVFDYAGPLIHDTNDVFDYAGTQIHDTDYAGTQIYMILMMY